MKQYVDVTDVCGSRCSVGTEEAVCLGQAWIGSKKSEKHQRARRAVFMYALGLLVLRRAEPGPPGMPSGLSRRWGLALDRRRLGV